MAPALLDTNVLVHAVYQRSALHAAAAELVDRGLRRRGLYCIAPQNLVEFAAVVTRPRLVEVALAGADVARITDLLYRSRKLAKIYPRRATVARTVRQGAALGISGPAWYDLFLAVTMVDAGVSVIITEDIGDFRRFPFIAPRGIRDAL
ncbi:MAG TPA: type II toxin-antitoxin system VapC family toxin [Gemmataceae bacterium]|jgi:predicted nucleic acid-binding protein|nr:type II toxin-antitoxin system VapC family toxin [Gemmataceae bacterium]